MRLAFALFFFRRCGAVFVLALAFAFPAFVFSLCFAFPSLGLALFRLASFLPSLLPPDRVGGRGVFAFKRCATAFMAAGEAAFWTLWPNSSSGVDALNEESNPICLSDSDSLANSGEANASIALR